MSYLVLARKWRPQNFEEVRGQDHVVRALRNAIESGRIAHAYIFTGTRGVGKTSAARILAKSLNCKEGPTTTPCGVCTSCVEIAGGKSPDVLEIDGASNTGVDDVRKLRDVVRYPPVGGGKKIYIIDEVHMLSTAAFNALLKTLEEPPPHVVFVFATTDPHKIPVTILSRCQQFDFKKLSARQLTSLLSDIAGAESVEIEEKGLLAIAREAGGSVRDSQSLLDQVISYAGQKVSYNDVRDVLGVVDRELLLGVARALLSKDAEAILKLLAEAEDFGFDVKRFGLDLLDLLRDLAVIKSVGARADFVEMAEEELAEASAFLSVVEWEEVHALFDMLAVGVEKMSLASRPGVVLEMTLLKMANMPSLMSLSDVIRRAGDVDKRVTSPPERVALPTGCAPVTPSAAARGQVAEKEAPAPSAPAVEGADEKVSGPVEAPAEEKSPAPPAEPPGPERTEQVEQPEQAAVDAGRPTGQAMSDEELWGGLLELAGEGAPLLQNVLKAHGKILSRDAGSNAVVVGVEAGHEFAVMNKKRELKALFTKLLGEGVKVSVELYGEVDAQKARKEASDRARKNKREALDHPFVKKVFEIFGGDIENIKSLG